MKKILTITALAALAFAPALQAGENKAEAKTEGKACCAEAKACSASAKKANGKTVAKNASAKGGYNRSGS